MSAPRAKEMWAPEEWGDDDTEAFHVTTDSTINWRVRVLVQEIPEGMPDFAIGERVDYDCGEWIVVASPFHDCDTWLVPIRHAEGRSRYRCVRAGWLTKLPREITRTIRVTGPEDEVERYVTDATSWHRGRNFGVYDKSLRVERVEVEP